MKEELNLNNPIFVFYINIEGMSRQNGEQYAHSVKNSFDIYSNITQWVVATTTSPTRIECVYDGKSKDTDLKFLIESINERIDILSDSKSFDDFKINIRDWRLKGILDYEKDNKSKI